MTEAAPGRHIRFSGDRAALHFFESVFLTICLQLTLTLTHQMNKPCKEQNNSLHNDVRFVIADECR